jgi:plastocyanin
MNFNVRAWLSGVAVASALVLAACGGTTGGGTAAPAALNVSTAGEALQFAPANLSATAGDIKVNFKNASAAQTHTWVLVKGGDDVAAKVDESAVANAGAVTPGGDVLAATKVVAANGSESITANVPAGTYTFICTVPGHYAAGMKGTLTVK